MKSKVPLLVMFEICLSDANLFLSLEYVDLTNLYEKCTIFQKLAVSSVTIFVLTDRYSWLHLLPSNILVLCIFKKSRKTVFAEHSHVF